MSDRAEDSGFTLMEVVVAITVIMVVMAGVAAFLMSSIASTSRSRTASAATTLSVAAIDRARAVGAAGAVSGRDSVSSNTQFTKTPASVDYPAVGGSVSPWLGSMTPAVDARAGTGDGAVAALPTAPTHPRVNGQTFTLNYYVGYCWRPQTAAGECTRTSAAGTVQYVRVVAAITWTGNSCPTTGCAFVSATLLNGVGDPVFNFNQAPPPTLSLQAVTAQASYMGTAVTGLRGVTGCTAPCAVTALTGVPPFAFVATGLPDGLALDDTGLHPGLITGTPTTAGTFSVGITVTDAFLSTASLTIAWTVKGAVTFTAPATQLTTAGQAVSLTLPSATGGSGTGYTWSATGLPTGLAVSGIKIIGTVPVAAVQDVPYDVALTVTDSAGNTATQHVDWRVDYAALAATPVNRTSTVGGAVNVALATLVSGGSGKGTWTDPSGTLPAGLALAPAGDAVTGIPTATVTSSVTLHYADTMTGATVDVPFTWTVVGPPTLTAIATRSTAKASLPSTLITPFTPTYTCPNGPCAWAASGLPPSLVINATTGQITGSTYLASRKTYTPTITLTDAAGVAVSVTFSWTIQ